MRCQVWPPPAPPQTFILWSYGGGAYPVMSRAEAIAPVKSSGRLVDSEYRRTFTQRPPRSNILHFPRGFRAPSGGKFSRSLLDIN